MSVTSWKKEFYPVSAKKPRTKIARIKHSLRKWEGLMPAMLKKHGIRENFSAPILVDQTTCALCIAYYSSNEDCEGECDDCPLCQTLNHPCDEGSGKIPWEAWCSYGDPRPMIRALRKTLKRA